MRIQSEITLTPEEQALISRLKSFRVPEMARILEEQLRDPNADLNTFKERMSAMITPGLFIYTFKTAYGKYFHPKLQLRVFFCLPASLVMPSTD